MELRCDPYELACRIIARQPLAVLPFLYGHHAAIYTRENLVRAMALHINERMKEADKKGEGEFTIAGCSTVFRIIPYQLRLF